MAFVGHIIMELGVAVDPKKIELVVDWSQPTNVTEVRSFLGLAGYYRHFVEGFSKLAALMNHLTRKGEKFIWAPKCQLSFDKLKRHLTDARSLPCRPLARISLSIVMPLGLVWGAS